MKREEDSSDRESQDDNDKGEEDVQSNTDSDTSSSYSDTDTSATLIEKSSDEEDEQDQDHLPGFQSFLKKNVTNRFSVGEKTGFPLLVACLRECLLTHRWREASQAVEMMCLYPTHQFEDYIWKCGVEVLYNHPDSNQTLIEQFNRKLEGVNVYLKKKRLEKVFYLLSRRQFKEAHLELRSSKLSSRTKVRKEEAKMSKFWEMLIKSYLGMLQYMAWHQDHVSESQTDGQQTQTEKNEEMQACSSLCIFTNQLGVWDIFVTKHVEILETTGNREEAKVVLENYCTQSEDNPNAFRYLYRFLKRNNGTRQEMIQALKEYVRRIPSDSLTLDLASLLRQGIPKKNAKYREEISVMTNALFDMLDYPCWYERLEPWKALAEHLTKTFKKQDPVVINIAKVCWSKRHWWPSYHFDAKTVHRLLKKNKKTVLQKAVVAILMHTPDSTFVRCVKKYFTEKNEERSLKQLNKATMLYNNYDSG